MINYIISSGIMNVLVPVVILLHAHTGVKAKQNSTSRSIILLLRVAFSFLIPVLRVWPTSASLSTSQIKDMYLTITNYYMRF